jgi:hypothetical protein
MKQRYTLQLNLPDGHKIDVYVRAHSEDEAKAQVYELAESYARRGGQSLRESPAMPACVRNDLDERPNHYKSVAQDIVDQLRPRELPRWVG